MGAGKRRGQSVKLLAQGGERGRAVRRELMRNRHPQFAVRHFQPRRRLERGVKQRAAYLVGTVRVFPEHPQQFGLHVVGGHRDRIRVCFFSVFSIFRSSGR